MTQDPRFSADRDDELADLRARYEALEARAEALREEALATTHALQDALAKQRAALEAAARSQATLAAIRASVSGRMLGIYGRLRAHAARMRLEWRLQAARRQRARRLGRVPRRVARGDLGVNVAGYINAESGMGEAVRCSIRALQRASIPVALNNVPGPQRMADATFTDFVPHNPQPFNLIHLNADNMAWFAGERGRAYFRDRYTIGYWFWELEEFRPDWLPAFDFVDEVWVASEHSRQAIGRDAPVPVVHVPLGLPAPSPARFGRAHFGLPDDVFVFLYTFDVSSQMERKNPLGAVRAFRDAAVPYDRAMLLLKFTNAHTNPAAVERLKDAAAGLNVRFFEGALDRAELNALMQVTDCCLSLHRAEGFGLTLAEQMSMGKPAIATAYSGNLDFMTPDVSCLVPARRVKIERDYGPYLSGYLWADPDLGAAAQHIAAMASNRERARDLGERGRQYVGDVLSLDRSSQLMRSRLDQIRKGRMKVAGVVPPIGAAAEYA